MHIIDDIRTGLSKFSSKITEAFSDLKHAIEKFFHASGDETKNQLTDKNTLRHPNKEELEKIQKENKGFVGIVDYLIDTTTENEGEEAIARKHENKREEEIIRKKENQAIVEKYKLQLQDKDPPDFSILHLKENGKELIEIIKNGPLKDELLTELNAVIEEHDKDPALNSTKPRELIAKVLKAINEEGKRL